MQTNHLTVADEMPVLVGCGYCSHCGYGGEPSDSCLHKRPAA